MYQICKCQLILRATISTTDKEQLGFISNKQSASQGQNAYNDASAWIITGLFAVVDVVAAAAVEVESVATARMPLVVV